MEFKNLGDLANFQKGFAFKSKDYLNNGVCKIVRVSNLTKDSINFDDCIYIDDGKYEEYKKYALEPGDIIITTVGSWKSNPNSIVGKVILVPENNYKLLLNQNAVRIRAKKGVNQLYLYYYLKGSDFQSFIVNTAQGSANQASITQNDIKSYKILNICTEHQSDLSGFFRKFDQKIETNNKIIANLEAQAQALFKYYFIDFEPFADGNFVDSDLGPIPEGWEVKKIKDVCDCKLGGTPKKSESSYWDGDIAWINSGEVNKDRILIPTRFITEDGLKSSSTKLLKKKTTLIAITGATLGQVSLLEIESCANQSIIGIEENSDMPYEYIYLYIKNNINSIISNQTGAAQQHINLNDVKTTDILVPNRSDLNNFLKKSSKLLGMVTNLYFQNQTLAEARDALLPRLMAGEIDLEGLGGSYD